MKKAALSLILCILLLLPSTLVNASSSQQFSDLGSDHWAYSAVMDMVSKGILEGFGDGTFRPNDPVTREQFAKILVLAMNIPQQNSGTQTFADVSKDDWAYPYVEAVRQYLTGYKNGNQLYFRGTQQAVREDMAVAIVMAKGLDSQTPDLSVLDTYADEDQISPNLRGYAAIAVKNKVMEGDGNYFYPQNTLTRAEACELIYKSSIANGNGTGEKVAVKDGGMGQDYKVYNDGNVTFDYPMGFDFSQNKDHMITPVPGFTNQIAEYNGMRITVTYTTKPELAEYTENFSLSDSTLDGILDSLNQGAFTNDQKQKLDNAILVNAKDRFGDFDMIFGRGIGKIVPRIQIDGVGKYQDGLIQEKTDAEKQQEETLRTPITNMILNSFRVINPTPSIGKGQTEDTTAKTFNDVSITFNYPVGYNFETAGSNSMFAGWQTAQSDNALIAVHYDSDIPKPGSQPVNQPTPTDTTLAGLKSELLNYYASSQITSYSNCIVVDNYAPTGEYKIIVGSGVGNKIPIVEIHNVNLDNPSKGRQEVDKILQQIIGSFNVISTSQSASSDTTAPKVVSTTPADGDINVTPNSDITIKYSKPIYNIDNAIMSIKDSSGNIIGKGYGQFGDNTQIVLSPQSMKADTKYIVMISRLKDVNGNEVPVLSFSFTTTADYQEPQNPTPPVASYPSGAYNGKILVSFQPINSDEIIWYTLDGSEPDPLNSDTANAIDSNSEIYITKTTTLKAKKINTKTLKRSDVATYNYVINTSTDTAAPKVISTTPADGATGVDLKDVTAQISITYDQNWKTLLSPDSIEIVDNTGTKVFRGISINDGKLELLSSPFKTIKINPAWDEMKPNTTYTVKLPKGIMVDSSGNYSNEYAFSFTTKAAADITTLNVTSTSIADGATNVGLNPDIKITFSGPFKEATYMASPKIYANGEDCSYLFTVEERTNDGYIILHGKNLTLGAKYTVQIDSIYQNSAGVKNMPYTFSFTTGS